MKLLLLLIVVASAFAGCQKSDPVQQVLRIKDMAELGTVEYTVSKIVHASDDSTGWKVGDRKILFSTETRIKAGVDFSRITSKDIVINDMDVQITLPRAKLIYMSTDPDKIVEEYDEIGLWRSKFSNEEKQELLAQGQKTLHEALPELGILEVAEKNTEYILKSWLKQSNFEFVEIIFTD